MDALPPGRQGFKKLKIDNWSFTLTLSIANYQQLYYGYGEQDLHRYDKCFDILDKYIAFVIWMNDDSSLRSTAGDGADV